MVPSARGRQWNGTPATSSGTSGCSSTITRVPPGASSSVHSTREGTPVASSSQRKRSAAAVLDLLDHAGALLAARDPGGAHRRALLGLELDLVGEPLLELGGLGQQRPGTLALDGEDDLSADGGLWHGWRLLQLDGCA